MPRPARTISSPDGVAQHPNHARPGLSENAVPFLSAFPEPARALPRPGLDFTAQDYLALASHPAIRSAVLAALGQSHPASSPSAPALALQARIAAFLQLPAALVFPSGTDAICATLLGLFHPQDDVIIDAGAHPAMFETTIAAGARPHRCPSGSLEGLERRLSRLGRQQHRGRIFIAVPAISAHGSRMADLAELTQLARQHGAVLIADVSHDLGALGQEGRGVLELQGCLGRVDVVLGSFAKTFAATGGFVALRDPALADALRPGQKHRAALSPVNATVIQTALDLVDSPEGRRRRRRLHGCALRLRNRLMSDGLRVMGQVSPLVPVRLPLQTAEARTRLLASAGPQVPLLLAPIVPGHAPRWRIQLTADHGAADIDDLAELICDVTRVFDRDTRAGLVPEPLGSD
ncbi:MAG: pyridoxal phosphate-dependent aminotransferase family protein [Tabrizicola sp.]|nr:pyridoxal phosphate-dependent aminotransferase family protein [Tabrizicola sp.]